MNKAPPVTPTCSSSRRCLQTAKDAVNPTLRGTACQGVGNANCSSCLTDNGTFLDSDLIQNLTSDCGDDLSTTRSNLCMTGACYTALDNSPDIIAGNANCMVQAGLQQSALRRVGCTQSDLELYCNNKAVGPAGCQSEYQTYENTDKYSVWKRPYGSGNSQDGYQFGANCPRGTAGIVLHSKSNDADYSVCIPLLAGVGVCPEVPTTSSVRGTQRYGFPIGIEPGVKGCLLPCGTTDDCPGGQECISGGFPAGIKFCAGRNSSDNRFYNDPTVSKLFRYPGCHSAITGNNTDCHSCIKGAANVNDKQAALFCDNLGMFHKANLPV